VLIAISDLKYAVRLVLKGPWFTLLTVLMLAGGLAISIYTFAIVNTMIYKDLPVADGHSIVQVTRERDGRMFGLDAYELASIRTNVDSLSEIGVYRTALGLFGDQESKRSVILTQTEWNIFEFTRTPPLLGRGFVRDDSQDGAEQVAVISYAIWQSVFLGDPSIVGQVARINGEAVLIVGIMPEGYAFPMHSEVWVPLSSRDVNPTSYSQASLDAYARLRPGISAESAAVELNGLLENIQRQRPDVDDESFDVAVVSTFQEALWGEWGPRVFAAVNALALFVLMLACVNVGNLLLARTNERIKEVAVRIALGARRSRLIVQMTLQNVIICAVGGVLALLVTARGLKATDQFLSSLIGNEMPFWWNWRLDGSVVVAAGLCLLLTIVMVSVLPVFTVSSVSPNAVIKEGIQVAAGRSAGRTPCVLVTMQVALISAVMLSGGTAAVIAYRMAHFDPGMDPTSLFVTQGVLPGETYDTPEEQLSFYERLLTELGNDGQIEAARITQKLGETEFAVGGDGYYTPGDYPRAQLSVMLETPSPVATTLLEGRGFDSRDSARGLRTVIVSESLARMYWPGESALGKRIDVMGRNANAGDRIVVGVVRDAISPLPEDESSLAIYVPLPQWIAPGAATVMIRHRGSDAQARAAIYEALESVGAATSVGRVNRYKAELEAATLFATTLTNLLIGCGAFAILLAMTGIYGLSSNAVIQRTHEIGLRRSMGATNGNIIGLFLARGSKQLAVGLAISGLISIVLLLLISQLARLAVPLLILMGAIVVLAVSAVVLISIYVSVWRAIRHEPSAALRFG
jgi:predicted permease